MAVTGKCGICKEKDSKYKCPKCKIPYCSLICFKSPQHSHDKKLIKKDKEVLITASPNTIDENISKLKPQHQKVFQNDKNEQLKDLLKIPELQIQLSIINEILTNPKVTNENDSEVRKEIAIKKLNSLRTGRIHENQLVEEFCQLFEQLSENN